MLLTGSKRGFIGPKAEASVGARTKEACSSTGSSRGTCAKEHASASCHRVRGTLTASLVVFQPQFLRDMEC